MDGTPEGKDCGNHPEEHEIEANRVGSLAQGEPFGEPRLTLHPVSQPQSTFVNVKKKTTLPFGGSQRPKAVGGGPLR